MSESEVPPENVSFGLVDKQYRQRMDELGERRLSQGVKPNLRHLHYEAKDAAESDVDILTKLLNRRAYEQREKELIKISKRTGVKLVFIRFDVNELKPINDSEGHSAGDLLLEKTGNTILESLRDTDIAGRVGGDEFKVTLVGANLNEAKKMWQERLLPKFIERKVKISAGASEVDTSSEENIKESDDLADDAQSLAKIASRTSNVLEFRTSEDLSYEHITHREELRKNAQRKAS